MLHSFGAAYLDLGREAVTATENGCANHGRESRIDENLTADDDETPEEFRVVARFVHAIDLAASHSFDWC